MQGGIRQTKIPLSLFHTPSDVGQQLFYSVLRAGHIITARDYRIERQHYPGHEFLFCLCGKGFIRVSNRAWPVAEGQVAWINAAHPHAHWPDEVSPWEIYWIRVEGGNLNQIYDILSVQKAPIFGEFQGKSIKQIYKQIFRLMRRSSPAIEARLHAQVSALVALLFESRFGTTGNPIDEPVIPGALQKCLETIRLYYDRPLKVPELARLAGTSVSHFFRLFKNGTGMTPIQWLKRERINQAKRRLAETSDSIASVAEQTGYSDQFYFSRDFKRVTKMTPSQYRSRERLHRKRL